MVASSWPSPQEFVAIGQILTRIDKRIARLPKASRNFIVSKIAAYAGMIQLMALMKIASKAPITKSGHSDSRSGSEDFLAVDLGTLPNLTPMSAYCL
jgi:hypothetical protein